jgi:membrane protein
MKLKDLFGLFAQTFKEWNQDRAPRLGAALAYYSVFSLAPLLIIAAAIVGLIFGEQAAQGAIVKQIAGEVGQDRAEFIQQLVKSAYDPHASAVATAVGLVTLFFGASGVFLQLQDALNTIWKVAPRPGRKILGAIKDHVVSFLMVLGIGVLLLLSVALSAAVHALDRFIPEVDLPGSAASRQILNIVASFCLVTLLFAMIYKILPGVQIAWRDVWTGAAVAAFLFTVGKYLIGLYLGHSNLASTFGLAGSLVALLIWIYYSAQILLFGAEFTRVYALRHGRPVALGKSVVTVTSKDFSG